MSRKNLDKADLKRLATLEEEFRGGSSSGSEKNFDAYDLRLLLEFSFTVQQLIREIAQREISQQAITEQDDREELSILQKQLDAKEQALCEAESRLKTLEEYSFRLKKDLEERTDTVENLLAVQEQHKQERDALCAKLSQTEQMLRQSKQALVEEQNKTKPSPAMIFLRQESALCERLGLSPLPNNDGEALIKIVAVLAQKDNVDRLWGVLKERCDTEQRQASNDELQLLNQALMWLNLNWQKRPYSLVSPQAGSKYDYEQYQRSQQTSTGEVIAQLNLPGIADGGGKILHKAVVNTH